MTENAKEGLIQRSVKREHVYCDVVDMYTEDVDAVLSEYPMLIRYKDERALDAGGVCRDLFSAFWEEAYLRHCDGERLFIIANNPSACSSDENLSSLGTILCHGFMVFYP